jgi:SPP1 family predicted phage head-tail adaptor
MAFSVQNPATTGELRERIQIEAPVLTTDALGQPVRRYQGIATVWAAVEPLSSKESHRAGQAQAQTGWQFVMRARRDLALTTEHRIRFRGRSLAITSVMPPTARERWMVVFANEGASYS